MADPFFAEIRIFGFNYAPQDWAFCDGTIINVQQNTPLFSLIGNTYGGTSPNTFALPDLRGLAVMGTGTSKVSGTHYNLADKTGVPNVSLGLTTGYPVHDHTVSCSVVPPTTTSPVNNTPAHFAGTVTAFVDYATPPQKPPLTAMHPLSMHPFGAATVTPHENRQPYLAMNFCICTNGVYPMFD